MFAVSKGEARILLRVFASKEEMAGAAARHAAGCLRQLLQARETVRLLAATGASQIEFLDRLTAEPNLDWRRVELFHLDEYVGIGLEHPASFARYIKDRIIDPTGIGRYHLLDGTRDPAHVSAEMAREIGKAAIDIAFVGIGENGHLAFNDPPANFDAEQKYFVVKLDEACRRQQVGEGWFRSIEDVPKQAVTISIPALLEAKEIICVVPDRRKARAVASAFERPISPRVPASALRMHPNATIYLDREAASLLRNARSGGPDPMRARQ